MHWLCFIKWRLYFFVFFCRFIKIWAPVFGCPKLANDLKNSLITPWYMYVCMCVCVCIHIHIHIHICMCMNISYILCYVICNCNVANIDVVALYLSERLNNNFYFIQEKIIFFCSYIYLFVRPFFVSPKKNSSNAATREKNANSLIARFFSFIKILSLVKAYF